MIGRIRNLSPRNRSGFIQAENGQSVYFTSAAVWEHDFPLLVVGQAVSFELQGGHWPKAANVHLFDNHHPSRAHEKPREPMQLRYVGFDQTGFVRAFRFQAVVSGEQTRDYTVTADVRLFQKYHIGIQEGPSLCTQVLLSRLGAPLDQQALTAEPELNEQDLAALVASRKAAPRKPFRRRPRPPRPNVLRPPGPS